MHKPLIFLVFICCSIFSSAQWQVGVFGGISLYNGDLSGAKGISRNFINSAAGATIRYELTDRINLRAGATFAKVGGDDKYDTRVDFRRRNLSFESSIAEFSVISEYHILDWSTKPWTPYLFAGLAVYHFDPYTYDKNLKKVYLQPLSTEGEGLPNYGKPYSLTQLAIPMGMGIKFKVSDRIVIGAELGLRKLFTDYLDDVSRTYPSSNDLLAARGQQAVDLYYRGDELPDGNPELPRKGIGRGNPKKDWYYFPGLHLSFRLGNSENNNVYTRKRSRTGCPSVPL